MAYDEATAQAVLEQISEGKTLSEVSRTGIVARATFNRWREEFPALETAFARAVDRGSEALEDRTADIEGKVERGELDAQSAYTILRNIHWRTSVRTPKRYNPKQQVELTGANGSDLFANLGKAELLAELSRRMSTPEIARALQALQQAQPGALPALPGVTGKVDKG